MQYSTEQILQMAPDTPAAKAGQQLASNAKWLLKAVNEKALWGDCQGSGKTPYRTMVDLDNIAFKCSCPSRKFPCKHGLGLMLLYVQQPDVFTVEASLPDTVAEWLSRRGAREAAKDEKVQKPVDEAAQEKRIQAREKKVLAGIEELRYWLKDVVRTGIMNVPQDIYGFNQSITARMVDAQAGGLANQLRQINRIDFFHEGWQLALLKRLSKIYLITEAFDHKEQLPPEMVQELQTLIGWTQSKEEVLQTMPVEDTWTVLSITLSEEEQLRTERVWLYGHNSKRYALLLQFYAGNQSPEHLWVKGMQLQAAIAYFPGAAPLRALIKSHQSLSVQPIDIEVAGEVTQIYEQVSGALSVNPFLTQFPFILNRGTLTRHEGHWWFKDAANQAIPLANTTGECWRMLAFSQGKPCSAFGIYEEERFALHTLWSDHKSCFVS
ncbi:SWIM zinc finger family protein [Taibaiella koreensis]|uniref:SWIM zinc finger family protein n=1 Tax=Taibaiella koreensis TaxID=1268548 RepID=UPI000E59C8E5|nr:SWIM zinc finger family protein [Taibaiella koreensis]